ncbi:MAG: GNAT family N-acetyltransferase [Actinobacteria bacterium]|nr:GNAT family N-acetyltransferase [Actinomycetota bacterium]
MQVITPTSRERPDLADRAEDIGDEIWPEYNRHGDVLNLHWSSLRGRFPDFQFVVYDQEADELLAEGHTIPCRWDGTIDGLPSGIDGVMEQGVDLHERGEPPNALSAIAIEIRPSHQGRGLSRILIARMGEIAEAHGFASLIAPVRPNWKERYPLTPIESYAYWTRDDGLPFDPWIRVHHRLGAEILLPDPRSLRITGSVSEWESWTEMAFPESGDYVFPHGLAPVAIDQEADQGRYWEPNVWMHHRVSAGN